MREGAFEHGRHGHGARHPAPDPCHAPATGAREQQERRRDERPFDAPILQPQVQQPEQPHEQDDGRGGQLEPKFRAPPLHAAAHDLQVTMACGGGHASVSYLIFVTLTLSIQASPEASSITIK